MTEIHPEAREVLAAELEPLGLSLAKHRVLSHEFHDLREHEQAALSALSSVLRERDEAVEALRPFAAITQDHVAKGQSDNTSAWGLGRYGFTYGDLRQAAAIVKKMEKHHD